MKHWDVIIIGGGIVGLSLSIQLRKRDANVLIVERGDPGREASYAAAGMLAADDIESSSPLKPLATASAQMYPQFVHELQDQSGINCDLREQGTLQFGIAVSDAPALALKDIAEMEPGLLAADPVIYLNERSVDPRALSAAAVMVAKHGKVDIVSGSEVIQVLLSDQRVSEQRVKGVRTDKTTYDATAVVNCAGAWSGQFSPLYLPARPVKGQLLSVVSPQIPRYVIRSPDVYLVPRSDGRLLIGATLEEAGFDKRTTPDNIRRMHEAAIILCPFLKESRVIEAWAGLRPGTPDNLPILGETSIPGYFVATGHFRDGILLAPVTARWMAQLIMGENPGHDLSAFSISRFEKPEVS